MASKNKKEWQRDTLEPALKRFPERQPEFKLSSDIEVQPLYTVEDVQDSELTESIGFPGEYPFGRGIQPTMYRGRLWTMRQYSGFASAEESMPVTCAPVRRARR